MCKNDTHAFVNSRHRELLQKKRLKREKSDTNLRQGKTYF